MDIKCRKAGIALDWCGDRARWSNKEDLKAENLKALEAGMSGVENVQEFGVVPIVSINRVFREAEINLVVEKCGAAGRRSLLDGGSLGNGREMAASECGARRR